VVGQFGGIAKASIKTLIIMSAILQVKANPDQALCQGDAAQICGTGMQSRLRDIAT
jgi:hypothetical protein